MIIVAIIISILIFIPTANKIESYNEMYTVNQLGLVNYHLQDLYNYVFESDVEDEVLQQLTSRRNNYIKTEDKRHFGLDMLPL
jgi:competence protein ComGC